jgi:dTDP-4-amino-4,6-dideoxygalactose transaminase
MTNRIPLAQPWFDSDEESTALSVLRSGWIAQGPRVAEFENAFAAAVGADRSVAVASGTAALHVAALALGLGRGDEVLVPAFSWISTANTAEYAGAKAVFCDIDLETFNIKPSEVAHRITDRTRAIVVVHQFGLCAAIREISAIAQSHDIQIIEDSACALGTFDGTQHVGNRGAIGCFSLHPRKSITSGEGGVLISSSDELVRTFRRVRDIGADREAQSPDDAARGLMPDFHELGFNYRMTDLQGAIATAQMKKLDRILESRRTQAAWYSNRIENSSLSEWLIPPARNRDQNHSYQAYVCLLRTPDEGNPTLEAWYRRRNELMMLLGRAGIGTRPGTHAPHMLSYYRERYGLRAEDYPNAWRADWLSLALPLFPQLTESQQETVCHALETLWPQTMSLSA